MSNDHNFPQQERIQLQRTTDRRRQRRRNVPMARLTAHAAKTRGIFQGCSHMVATHKVLEFRTGFTTQDFLSKIRPREEVSGRRIFRHDDRCVLSTTTYLKTASSRLANFHFLGATQVSLAGIRSTVHFLIVHGVCFCFVCCR